MRRLAFLLLLTVMSCKRDEGITDVDEHEKAKPKKAKVEKKLAEPKLHRAERATCSKADAMMYQDKRRIKGQLSWSPAESTRENEAASAPAHEGET